MNITYFRPRKPGPEVNLEDSVVRWLPQYVRSNDYQVWAGCSVPIGAGVPDIVAATYRPELANLTESRTPMIHILAYLRSVGRARLGTISKRMGLSNRRTAEFLEDMIQMNAINSKHGLFKVTATWRVILPEIVTVEAKVADWRRGMAQARRNLIFSNQSLLALPKRIAERVKSHSILHQCGIGLLAVGEDNEVSVIRRCRSTRSLVWSYYYQLASYIATDCEVNADAL